MSNKIGKAIQGHAVNLEQFWHDKIYDKVDQILSPIKPLYEIDEAHCGALWKPCRNYRLDCVHGRIKIYVSAAVNPIGTAYASAVHN